jgi:hypothetical protein
MLLNRFKPEVHGLLGLLQGFLLSIAMSRAAVGL